MQNIESWLPDNYKQMQTISEEGACALKWYLKSCGVDTNYYCLSNHKKCDWYSKALHYVASGKGLDVESMLRLVFSEQDGRGVDGFITANTIPRKGMFFAEVDYKKYVEVQWDKFVKQVVYIIQLRKSDG